MPQYTIREYRGGYRVQTLFGAVVAAAASFQQAQEIVSQLESGIIRIRGQVQEALEQGQRVHEAAQQVIERGQRAARRITDYFEVDSSRARKRLRSEPPTNPPTKDKSRNPKARKPIQLIYTIRQPNKENYGA